MLRRVVAQLTDLGFAAKAAFEIEAMVFTDSLDAARRRHFRGLTPMSTNVPVGYLHHNSRQQLVFVDEVLARLEALGIPVEGWHDEAAPAQFEINLDPADPLTACDHVVRAKQVMREVAIDQGRVVTFMAKPSEEYGNGLHVHHCLTRNGEPVFYAPDGTMSDTTRHWLGGLMASAPAATSFLCPNINSYRRMVGFAAAPTVASWGEDNKSAALRVLSESPKAARIEYRVAGGDANPYLVLAVALASGVAGLAPTLDAPGARSPCPDGGSHPTGTRTCPPPSPAPPTHSRPIRASRRSWATTSCGSGSIPAGGNGSCSTPRAETRRPRAVTDWELDRYFELI